MLFPVANKPVLDWTFKNLAEAGVDTIILAVNHLAESLVRYFGPRKFGADIIYQHEEKPLGRGGPVKKAAELLENEDFFFVLNGDCISQSNYSTLVEYHKRKNGLATISLTSVQDPSKYDVVDINSQGEILRFIEKPSLGDNTRFLINAGTYIFDRQILDYIPPGRSVDTETEVFPILANESKLYGYEMSGYWLDIGVPEEYFKANEFMLSQLRTCVEPAHDDLVHNVEVVDPICLEDSVEVGSKSKIGPFVSIGNNVRIGTGCRIEKSILFPNVQIGDFTSVNGAILGEGVNVEKWVNIEPGSMIGDYAVIKEGVTIPASKKICPHRLVRRIFKNHASCC